MPVEYFHLIVFKVHIKDSVVDFYSLKVYFEMIILGNSDFAARFIGVDFE